MPNIQASSLEPFMKDILEAAGVETTPTHHAPDGLLVTAGNPLRSPDSSSSSGSFGSVTISAQKMATITARLPPLARKQHRRLRRRLSVLYH